MQLTKIDKQVDCWGLIVKMAAFWQKNSGNKSQVLVANFLYEALLTLN